MRQDPSTILARHRAFWGREPVDRPILSVQAYTPLQPLALDLPAAYLEPDQLRVEEVLHANQPVLDSGRVLQDDLFFVGEPYQPVPWMEAIVGCPIRVSQQTGSFWAEPVADGADAIKQVELDERWLAKLLEYTRGLVEHSRGGYPVVQALMRGPVDLLSALLGDEVACISLVISPVQTRRLLSQLADAFVEVVQRQMAVIPPYWGGYVNWYGLWSPGVPVRLQADNGALLSPRTYRDFLLPLDDRIARSFDYALIHLHSGWLHFVDELLTLDSLAAIQVSIDPFTARVPELLPTLRRILERKPLVLTGPMTREELDLALASLPATGLCLGPQIQDAT